MNFARFAKAIVLVFFLAVGSVDLHDLFGVVEKIGKIHVVLVFPKQALLTQELIEKYPQLLWNIHYWEDYSILGPLQYTMQDGAAERVISSGREEARKTWLKELASKIGISIP